MDATKMAVHAAAPAATIVDSDSAYMDVEHSETTDSGVQLLDSESTEMNASMVISGGFDDSPPEEHKQIVPDTPPPAEEHQEHDLVLTKSDIENSNIPTAGHDDVDDKEQKRECEQESQQPAVDDSMISSQCSTFDTNESIVYRRRNKRQPATPNPPKKRVSFHEDILKNTKTDNIHIEHGFITYKNGVRLHNGAVASAAAVAGGRYSWCSAKGTDASEFQDVEDPDYVIYRNACSEVLDYGKTDIYDGVGEPPKCDNSGVFEYADSQNGNHLIPVLAAAGPHTADNVSKGALYKCQCSDSNSSLESNAGGGGDVDVNSNKVRGNYAQTKSSSCDCFGQQSSHPPSPPAVMNDNCYYSEPNIGNAASVWSKEKKPKSSCLKKTRHTDFSSFDSSEQEAAKTKALQKFNIHPRRNNNGGRTSTTTSPSGASGKSLFGSLKNIFSMPLPERGVPEGQEDAQAVHEATPEDSEEEDSDTMPVQPSPGSKSRSFLSKSFDGGFLHENVSPSKKKFIHSVDEQLRKKSTEQERSSPKRTMARSLNSAANVEQSSPAVVQPQQKKQDVYRNKFIINCESTVFEHTGISYSYEGAPPPPPMLSPSEGPRQAESSHSYLTQKISKWTNMFRSSNVTREPPPTAIPPVPLTKLVNNNIINSPQQEVSAMDEPGNEAVAPPPQPAASILDGVNAAMECSFASSNSTMTDVSSLVSTPTTSSGGGGGGGGTATDQRTPSGDGFSKIFGGSSSPSHHQQQQQSANRTPTRHLASPLRKKSLPRYAQDDVQQQRSRMSPDLFNNYVQFMGNRAPIHDLRTSSLLSEDFDDILTVTTSGDTTTSTSMSGADRNDDMVIVDYPEITIPDHPDDSDFLKPASSKSSLINRFLRNVTQKKIMEATIALNKKLVAGSQQVANGRPVAGSLYVRGVRPMNRELIEDLNAEIAMEIEQSKSGVGGGGENVEKKKKNVKGMSRKEVEREQEQENQKNAENGFGVGEIPVETFKGVQFPFIGALRPEFLMKVFKLYIGYNRDGIMTPVLVFLTNKTLYVTDLVRSTLCNKFVMPYAELDVILLGPYGNTVLLCNGDRDMQQVLLAGGPNQANALVSSLELCARRGGLQLPSIGQLTLDHLAPLQNFVRDSSKTVDRREKWLYYAVVSISPMTTAGFTEVQEQLGANINGPLMHRSMSKAGVPVTQWSASYFLLKAGVLYMFPTMTTSPPPGSQKLPSWAVTLTECQGVRRMMNAGRPHCFELLLKTGALQLAGSDEYAASDWMQALVQSASGLFELEEKRSHYGCTLVLTSSHIITLREDFTEPLKRVASQKAAVAIMAETKAVVKSGGAVESNLPVADEMSEVSCSSTVSTPNRMSYSGSSTMLARKRSGGDLQTSSINGKPKEAAKEKEKSGYSKMFSQYGKDSGMEILSCADIGELISVKVSERSSVWWCSLEFSCQECVQENSDDVVVHFATESEQERFLSKLKEVWRAKTKDVEEFPLQRIIEEEDPFGEHCTKLFTDINKMWDPLVTAALGYPK